MFIALRSMTIAIFALLLGAGMAEGVETPNAFSSTPQLNAVLEACALTAVIALLYRVLLEVLSPPHLGWREKLVNSLVLFGMACCAGSVLLILPLGYYDIGGGYQPSDVRCAVIASIVGAIALWLELVELQVSRLNEAGPSRLYFRVLPILASVMVPALSIPALAGIIALNNANSWKSAAEYLELIEMSEQVASQADKVAEGANTPSAAQRLKDSAVSLQAAALEFDRQLADMVAHQLHLVSHQDARRLSLRIGQIQDRIREAANNLLAEGRSETSSDLARIAGAIEALQPILHEATDWTCHGFAPVTCLITPPWLRTRAG